MCTGVQQMRTEPHQVRWNQMPSNIWLKSGCPVPSKVQRALGNLAGSCIPHPPSAKIIICKGRNCSLFSVFLHALTNSLAMFPSSQAGGRTGEGTGTRQAGDAAARAPLLSIPGYPSPFTWGCSRHGNGRVFPGWAENQLFPLLSPISISQRSPSCILVRPVRSPVHPSARQQQVLGVRRGWHAACKAAARLRLSGCSGKPPKKLRWPPGAGWCCGRAGVWPAAGTRSRRCCCCCCISTSAYYAGENGLLVGAFQPLRHPVAGISQGRNLPAWLLLSPV